MKETYFIDFEHKLPIQICDFMNSIQGIFDYIDMEGSGFRIEVNLNDKSQRECLYLLQALQDSIV